jgi:BirA family biotin operon repressor/biotin-[acetyl-CoA-carboxylase] ligase
MKICFETLAGKFPLVGNRITHLESTTSTMDIAWEQAALGAPDGSVVVADHQSKGRGRYDRTWISGQGQDILCSVVLRPRVALAGELLMLAALAVTDVAAQLGIESGIKWPNDIQVGGKKLAGVIAESKTGPEQGGGAGTETDRITAIIGIGLNVNFDPETVLEAAPLSTSLSRVAGYDLDRLVVFEQLMHSLDSRYSSITAGGSVIPEWRERLTTLGRRVTVASGKPGDSSELVGVAQDVDPAGRLIVRDENGRDWPVSAGEVTVRRVD